MSASSGNSRRAHRGLRLPAGSDVIVIGGGIIGMSIAWRLAQQRIRVTVLEAESVGGEASWAAAGMLAPGGEVEEASSWSSFAFESLRLYPSFVEELEQEAGCRIDYRQSGAIDLAFTGHEWSDLLARAQCQRRLGIESSRIAPSDLPRLVRNDVHGALFYPQDAQVNPREIVQTLHRACTAHAVVVRERETAVGVHSDEYFASVHSNRQIYTSSCVVLAAGAWSSSIPVRVNGQRRDTPHAFPVRGHLLGYQLDPNSLPVIVRHGHTYILQRSSGFTIAGGSSEQAGFNRELNGAIVSGIDERAARIVPALSNPKPWLGFRPAIESPGPAVERLAGSRIWLAYGHYRNGILLAPATAQRVAANITASSERGCSSPAGSR
ncbi:MAG: FAD-dependent oxidoreductase [Acidobacteriota bacterium]|nr:FAD-dependent oxidoreductase [Acidobacteriota bacterium]